MNCDNVNENDLTQNKCSSWETSSKKRCNQNDFVFKIDAIDQEQDGNPIADVVFYNRIDKSIITRWLMKKREIIDSASSQHRKLLKKKLKQIKLNSNKYENPFVKLNQKFDLAQSKDMQVSFSWLTQKLTSFIKKPIKMLNVYLHQSLLAFLGNAALNLEERKGRTEKIQKHPCRGVL